MRNQSWSAIPPAPSMSWTCKAPGAISLRVAALSSLPVRSQTSCACAAGAARAAATRAMESGYFVDMVLIPPGSTVEGPCSSTRGSRGVSLTNPNDAEPGNEGKLHERLERKELALRECPSHLCPPAR